MGDHLLENVKIVGEISPPYEKILTPQAIAFLVKLHGQFNQERISLLQKRQDIQCVIDEGSLPNFLTDTVTIRQDPSWEVAPAPDDLQRRWVEITGPTERKMMINALNSGADAFMADFEDANSPTWSNMIEGQMNLMDAVDGKMEYVSPEGKNYQLNEKTAVIFVRPRGWHLLEKHFLIDGQPISASLFDFGLYFFHNVQTLLKKGSAPYFYLPKIENHLEARLWNDVFLFAQEDLGVPRGTIRATVLLETILAAFEMEEILYELREHSAGLNAGRWDYIFSIIKKFRNQQTFLFPDRSEITMTVPFMQAYTQLLVKICHKRGAHAMGGMAAFIPSRKDKEINEKALRKVREDKLHESSLGFDGTWVAHPDLVPVAREIFEKALQGKPNQKDQKKDEIHVTAAELVDFNMPKSKITENGLRQNISIALQYIDSWLCGIGAVAIFNLMEDAATAEISRAQLWQWLHHPNAIMDNGVTITPDLYRQLADEEMEKINVSYGENRSSRKIEAARKLLDSLVLDNVFPQFLTLAAYDKLD